MPASKELLVIDEDEGAREEDGMVRWASRSWPLVLLVLGSDDLWLRLNAFGCLTARLGATANCLALPPHLGPHQTIW